MAPVEVVGAVNADSNVGQGETEQLPEGTEGLTTASRDTNQVKYHLF